MYILYCVLAVLFITFMYHKINILRRTHAQNIFYTNFGELMFITWCCWLRDLVILRSMFLKKAKWCFDISAAFLHPREANIQETHMLMVCWEVNNQPDSTVVLPLLSVHAEVFEVSRKDLTIYCLFLGLWFSFCLESPLYDLVSTYVSTYLSNLNWFINTQRWA